MVDGLKGQMEAEKDVTISLEEVLQHNFGNDNNEGIRYLRNISHILPRRNQKNCHIKTFLHGQYASSPV